MGNRTKAKKAATGDYEVGYRRPPKEHRFRPGEIHNPRGRPSRPKPTLAEILTRVLAEIETIEINGERRRRTNAEIIAMALLQKAIAGDVTARRLMARLHMDFDRELVQEQNEIQWGVRIIGDDYEEVKKKVFEELRRKDPDGDEEQARQSAHEIAFVRTLVKPERSEPLPPINRRRGAS